MMGSELGLPFEEYFQGLGSLGFRVWCLGFRVRGLSFGVVKGLGYEFGVWGSGLKGLEV